MTGGMAGGTTPPHQPNPFLGSTGDPMYPRPPVFPCPLPTRLAFPCPLLPAPCCPAFPCPFFWSPSCPSPIHCAPCPLCLFLPLSSSPASLSCTPLLACPLRWLPPSCPLYRWPWRPVAAALLCPACPSPLCGPPLGCPLCTPPDPSCSPWRSGSGAWRRRRWRSMCASASYRAVCWRRASLSSSARTAALTCGGDAGGCCLNECWGCGHCHPCPPPFPPVPSWCPVACLAPDVPACPFPPLPVCPRPPVRTPLSPPSAAPAPARPHLL